jgi:hypothetical protein
MSLPFVNGGLAAGGRARALLANISVATTATSKDINDFVLIILPP